MRKRERISKWKMLDDTVSSISIALIEVELFTLPVWLTYVVFSNLNSIPGYSPAWIFGYWLSIASYIGIERVVRTVHDNRIWRTSDTLLDALISVLVFSGIGVLAISLTISFSKITNSFLLSLIFCIFSPIMFIKFFELLVINLEKLNKLRGGV